MKVAVTGAGGFVGRHVVRELSTRDVDVVPSYRSHAPAGGVVFDMRTVESPWSIMGRPDVLIHLAWGGLPNYRADTHVNDELPVQMRFLGMCIDEGLPSLAVVGTCLEYGMASGELEEGRPMAPVTAYGIAKDRLRKDLIEIAAGRTALTWLRLFYVYGDGQSPNSLYPALRAAVGHGDKSFDMSPGDQLRDFLPITQAAHVVSDLATRHSGSGVTNVCSGRPIAVVDMVKTWLAEWGADIELRTGVYPYPDYEPHAFWGSRRKLDDLLVS